MFIYFNTLISLILTYTMGRKKKYFTEEERIAARRESCRKSARKWREANPEYIKKWIETNPDYFKQRYQENSEKIKEIVRKYKSTPIGRANHLASSYRIEDKKHNRGECTITGEWMVDNIFSGQRCFYCGESDWTKLGCDRIDNSLIHTPDNVVPCCEECNKKRGRKDFVEFLKEIGRLDKLKELKDKVIITDNVFAD